MTNDIIPFTWGEMERLHREVAAKIVNNNFSPDIIIGILRCAMVPATHLAYILNINELGSISIRTTPSDDILVKKTIPPKVCLTYPLEKVRNKKILLVDTVMASGTSVMLSIKSIAKYSPASIKTAIMVDWPNSTYDIKSGGSRPIPDFIGTTVEKWPDFPWEH